MLRSDAMAQDDSKAALAARAPCIHVRRKAFARPRNWGIAGPVLKGFQLHDRSGGTY